jgi:hypothetical protein
MELDPRPPTPPSSGGCATHPLRAAAFYCDGCGKRLCDGCIETGHRLLFCRHCGERALPLAANGAATSQAHARQQRIRAPYPWRDALSYPVRGKGGALFWVVVALAAIRLWPGVTPIDGIVTAVVGLLLGCLVLFLWPALLFSVARTSAEGRVTLPNWPDFLDPARVREIVAFLAATALVVLPAVAFGLLLGCAPYAPGDLMDALRCAAAVALGCVIGVPLLVPAFGAAAVYQDGWLIPRLDLHVRALRATGEDGRVACGLVLAALLSGQLAGLLLGGGFLPRLLDAAVSAYASLLAAHLSGVLFRRNERALAEVYGQQLP